MSHPLSHPARLLLAATAGLSSCAVYVPTTPTTPLLQQKGEAEVLASLRGTGLEAGAAWSPARHLLLAAEAVLQTSNGSTTRNNSTVDYRNVHRQAGLGVGTYRLLGPEQSTYLAVVGGVGVASASIHDTHIEDFYLILPIPGPLLHYQAHYRRYYAQVYGAELMGSGNVSVGTSMRGTLLEYRHLSRNAQPITASSRVFLEPSLFLRWGGGLLQGHFTFGYSLPLGADARSPDRRNLTPSTMLLSAGLVLRPHLFGHRQRAVGARQ